MCDWGAAKKTGSSLSSGAAHTDSPESLIYEPFMHIPWQQEMHSKAALGLPQGLPLAGALPGYHESGTPWGCWQRSSSQDQRSQATLTCHDGLMLLQSACTCGIYVKIQHTQTSLLSQYSLVHDPIINRSVRTCYARRDPALAALHGQCGRLSDVVRLAG